MKRVLVLHSSADLYGASRSIIRSVEVLIKEGNEVYFMISKDGPISELAKSAGAHVIIGRLGVIRKKYLTFIGLINRTISIVKSILQIFSLVKKHNVDVIYTNTVIIWSGAITSFLLNIPHIWHVREIIHKPLFLKRIIGYLMRISKSNLLCVSNAVVKSWVSIVSSEKIFKIYNGINHYPFLMAKYDLKRELSLSDEVTLIGMVGRVNEGKGHKYFLRIAEEAVKQNKNFVFIMVGDPFPGSENLYEEIKDVIKSHSLLKTCVFDLGFRTDIAQIMSGLDIFILPSTGPDSFPTVILEAMASAKPVVATSTGGASEMIENGLSGFIIPIDDPIYSAKILLEKLDTPEKRNDIGFRGRTLLKDKFTFERYYKNFKILFNNLSNEGKSKKN